ncbi:hypothetical protein [Thermococcus sp.]
MKNVKNVKILIALLLMGFVVLVSGCESPDVKSTATVEKSLTLNGITVYYSGDASLSDAKATISFVRDVINPEKEMDVYLKKSGGAYTVGLTSTYKSADEIEDFLKFYLPMIASEMSQDVFGGAHVTLQILDDERNLLESAESKYSYVNSGDIYVWYSGTGKEDAQKVLDYAVSLVGNGSWDIILEKSDVYHIKAMSAFRSREEIGSSNEEIYKKMASDLSSRLEGKVMLHVLDPNGKEIAVFNG